MIAWVFNWYIVIIVYKIAIKKTGYVTIKELFCKYITFILILYNEKLIVTLSNTTTDNTTTDNTTTDNTTTDNTTTDNTTSR